MRALNYDEIFELIKDQQMLKAFCILKKNLFRDCYGFVLDQTRTMPTESRKDIFDEAFTDFGKAITSGKFVYSGDSALRNYFMGACKNQIRNRIKRLIKKHRYEVYLSEIMRGISEEVFVREYDTVLKEIQEEKKTMYNLDLGLEDEEDDFYDKLKEVNQIISKLRERCQKIIHLFFFMHIPHKEIPQHIPELANERVAITTLSRCIHQIREQLFINKNYGTE